MSVFARLVRTCGLLLAIAIPAVAGEPEEWDRELPPEVRFWEPGGRTHLRGRVVDDATGEPIADVRVVNWYEPAFPQGEPWEMAATYESDRDGWILFPRDVYGHWYFAEAPGWAPLARFIDPTHFRMVRGEDHTVEVRDWLDRRVPGATVEVMIGCGHTPAVRTVVTGPDGRVVIPCVSLDQTTLWLRADGLAGDSLGYRGLRALPVENGVRVLRAAPAPAISGRILNADGTPAAGAIVGSYDKHRGPWTKAGPDGRFRLLGAKPYDGLVAFGAHPNSVPDGVEAPRADFPAVPGVVQTVRLGEQDAKPRARLLVRVKTDATLSDFEFVRVVLVPEGGGRAEVGKTELKDGVAEEEFDVAPGTWRVTAGEAAGRLRPATRRVDVGKDGAKLELTTRANPVWAPKIEGMDRPPSFVITAEGKAMARLSLDVPGAIHVPAEGHFVVELEVFDGRTARAILDGPPTGEGPVLVLPPPAPEEPEPTAAAEKYPAVTPAPDTEIEVRAVDATGKAVSGFRVFSEGDTEFDEDGVVRIRGVEPGPVRFWVESADHRMHDIRLVIAEGERRKLVVRMNPR